MLLAGRTLDEGDRPALEQILKASDRAADLTAQLLTFSRRQNTQPKVLSLNAVVSGMSKMVRRLIGDHIDLRIQLRDDAGIVRVDSGKAEQVILNLAVNSRDALRKGGKLTISTRREDLDEEKAAALRLRPGRYAVLAVNDTGVGMDPKVRERVFEPFFTTKEVGQGTGLGLAVVHGIVVGHGGRIECHSKRGDGSVFTIFLPAMTGNEAAPVMQPAA
jgi:signal transduction histidine kinase